MRAAEREGHFGVVMIGAGALPGAARLSRGSPGLASELLLPADVGVPEHYYFYIRDREWGPAFIKTVAYAPYGIAIYLNGHEWACDARSHAVSEHARLEVRLMS